MDNKWIKSLFFLSILICPLKSFSQFEIDSYDSMIGYTLLSIKDTGSKIPQSKVQNFYTKEGLLNEKLYFIWDAKLRQWKKEKRFALRYYSKEILIDCYKYEFFKQEILASRVIIKYDSSKNQIQEVAQQLKDRYSEHYKRWSLIKYTYLKETLMKEEYFKSGTTFFKEKEVKYKNSKDKILKTETRFKEIEIKPERFTKTISQLKNGKIESQKTEIESDYKVEYKDTFIYAGQILISTKHEAISRHKSIIPNDLIDNNHTITYDYNHVKKVVSSIQIVENEKSQSIQHPFNLLTYYFLNSNSTTDSNLYLIQQLEYHLGSMK